MDRNQKIERAIELMKAAAIAGAGKLNEEFARMFGSIDVTFTRPGRFIECGLAVRITESGSEVLVSTGGSRRSPAEAAQVAALVAEVAALAQQIEDAIRG